MNLAGKEDIKTGRLIAVMKDNLAARKAQAANLARSENLVNAAVRDICCQTTDLQCLTRSLLRCHTRLSFQEQQR